MKKAFVLISLLTLCVFAQEPTATPEAPSTLSTLSTWWALLALPLMGILSIIVHNIPGDSAIKKTLVWVVDLFSANVAHKK